MRFQSQKYRRAITLLFAALLASCGFSVFGPTNQAYATNCGDVLISGPDWAGGNGLDVHFNGVYQGTGDSCAGSSGIYNLDANPPRWGMGWQCVELAARLYKAKGWSNGLPGVSYAAQIYTMADSLNMTAMAQGSIDITKIVPGDMVVSNQATYGHVSVVSSVDVSANKVTAVEQNANSNGWATYDYSTTTKKLTRGTYYNVTGVVHDPDNSLVNGDSSSPNGSPPQIFALKRTTDPNGVRQVYAGTNTAVTEGWWVPGGGGVHVHEIIKIDQHNIVGFDKVNLPGGTQALYTATSNGVWESWWKPDGSSGQGQIVSGLSGVKGVIAYNTTENSQFVHHLYILAGNGPYEAWWKDGGDGIHLSLLTSISGGVTFTMSIGPNSTLQLYVAVPTWVYEVWWHPGLNDIHVGAVLNIAQGDIRSLSKGDNPPDGGQLLYTGTSTTAWQSYWNTGADISNGTTATSQVNAGPIKKTVTDGTHQLYVATSDHVQEYWWNSTGSGGGELIRIAQNDIGAIDKVNDGGAQDLYTGAGNWVYETWWGGGHSPSTSSLFSVAH